MIPYFSFNKIIIGPITLDIWWTFFVLAFLFGYFFTLKQAKKAKIDIRIIHNLFIWTFLGAIIGARLGYILQFPKEYLSQPLEILKFWQGGLTLFGGIFGALIAVIFYFKLAKVDFQKNFWQILDSAALSLPLSFALGRIGCSLLNDHQGAETSLPWGIQWPDGTIRHPVAEYLIINNLVLFFILKFLKSRLKKPGQLFFSFLFLYSFSRFFLDFTRSMGTPLSDPYYFGLSTTQWLSLMIMFGIILVGSRYFFKSIVLKM
jgi:phosphatidylglycerol:prolipoprotein diacylglycerol transferase